MNMSFELDNVAIGTYFHQPSGETDAAGIYKIAYNVSVYSNAFIPSGNHTMRIASLGESQVLFDYAIYTYVHSTVLQITNRFI